MNNYKLVNVKDLIREELTTFSSLIEKKVKVLNEPDCEKMAKIEAYIREYFDMLKTNKNSKYELTLMVLVSDYVRNAIYTDIMLGEINEINPNKMLQEIMYKMAKEYSYPIEEDFSFEDIEYLLSQADEYLVELVENTVFTNMEVDIDKSQKLSYELPDALSKLSFYDQVEKDCLLCVKSKDDLIKIYFDEIFENPKNNVTISKDMFGKNYIEDQLLVLFNLNKPLYELIMGEVIDTVRDILSAKESNDELSYNENYLNQYISGDRACVIGSLALNETIRTFVISIWVDYEYINNVKNNKIKKKKQ